MLFFIVLILSCWVGSLSWALPRLDGKIVGGSTTTIDKYPYQVSVLHYGLHVCGGTLLDSEWVITAAHCVKGSSASTLSVRLGATDRNMGGEVIKVSFEHIHPKYDSRSMVFDIAVLKLMNKAPSDLATIKSIDNLASPWAVIEGEATVSGWGATEEEGDPVSQLRFVSVDLIDTAKCKPLYGGNLIQDTMICAGVLPSGGKDACQGDSGGPLVKHEATNGSTTLVGVVSWGFGCARPNYPGVYSSIAVLGDWIMSVVVPRPMRK